MASVADRIYGETKTLAEAEAREVPDFIGHLKQKAGIARAAEPVGQTGEADADWAEFEKLGGCWSGKFDREGCYDRPIRR